MQPSSFQIHKLNVLIEYKELLVQLYQLCYQRFPEHKELWTKLYNEKKSHIQWINGLESGVEKGVVTINPAAFKVEAMRFIMQGINSKIEELKTNPLTFEHVLIYVKETENSMLEKNFFNIFQKESTEFKTKRGELESEHRNNLNMIQLLSSEISKPQKY